MNKMERLILGTVQFGLDYGINNAQGKPHQEEVNNILNSAWQQGIRTLDTAYAYGNAEELIGQFHHRQNQRFQINTKFTSDQPGTIDSQVTESLKTGY
jgi:aryl-alcohol dehydrogenase-like predicted oxidoreductase